MKIRSTPTRIDAVWRMAHLVFAGGDVHRYLLRVGHGIAEATGRPVGTEWEVLMRATRLVVERGNALDDEWRRYRCGLAAPNEPEVWYQVQEGVYLLESAQRAAAEAHARCAEP